jgi:hypothetical protein
MKHLISDIKLGLRQLTFGFAEESCTHQERVMACLVDQFQRQGHATLEAHLEFVKESHGLTELEILQDTFWLAEDLKIQFRIKNESCDPVKTHKILLSSPDQPVAIFPVEDVAQALFEDAKGLFRELTGHCDLDDPHDQHGFALLLAKEMDNWKKRLKVCLSEAQRPHFPGKKEIGDCLDEIQRISARRDAYSLITAVCENKTRMLALREQVGKISTFYSRHIDFWCMLVQSLTEFDRDLEVFEQDGRIVEILGELKQIVFSPSPYESVSRAAALFQVVKGHHDNFIREKTDQLKTAGLTKVDRMIERMRSHLEDCHARPDFRNKTLYSLRRIAKHITAAETIVRIDQLVVDAEETFDTMWERAEENRI